MASSLPIDFCQLIKDRQFYIQNRPKLPRLELNLEEYSKHTPNEYAMRRKVEVLKHSKNSNNISLQNYGDRINKKIRNALTAEITCATRPTRTTECDVPGIPMIIQYDPTIPLINYLPQETRTFISDDYENNTFYIFKQPNNFANQNQQITDANNNKTINTANLISTMKITFYNSIIDNEIANIPFKLQLGISFNGTSINTTHLIIKLTTIDVYIYTNNLPIGKLLIIPNNNVNDFLLKIECDISGNFNFKQSLNYKLDYFLQLNNANMNVYNIYLIPNFSIEYSNIANINTANYEIIFNSDSSINISSQNVANVIYSSNQPIIFETLENRFISKNKSINPYKMKFM